MTRTVGIVVPAYRPDVSVLRDYLVDLEREIDPQMLRVELDAPKQETVATLQDTAATINTVDHRRGKGAAITEGFEALSTEVLAFADADGSTPAESIRSVVNTVRGGDIDVAVGSRRHPDAEIRSHQTVLRQHFGDAFAWIARRLLAVDLWDYQCGAKAMTRETWLTVREHLYEPGFAWDVEVLAMADAFGFEIGEVPVVWIDHPESTVRTTSAVPELLRALFAIQRRAKVVKGDVAEGTVSTGRQTVSSAKRPLVERD